MSVVVGSKAPDFTLTNQDREPVTLSQLKGKPVVLAFFPAAFSSVCAKEMCTFRDSMAQLGKANAQVFGISVDTFFTLKAFQDQQKLTFPLLSDFNKQVIRDYGVFNEDMIGLKGIAKRAVFVIDKDGIVRHQEVLEDARNEPDYQKVFDALALFRVRRVLVRRTPAPPRCTPAPHPRTCTPPALYTQYMSICSYIQVWQP